MEKFLVTIEFVYYDKPNNDEDNPQYCENTITLGVFDTRDEANIAGNKALEIFEQHFKLNRHWNRKDRFSNNGGCFGSPVNLITDLAYLETPFSFSAKITKLKYHDVEKSILEAIEATKRYQAYKEMDNE